MMKVRHLESVVFDRRTALTVGTFDGVHRGHRSIIDRMREVANENNERTVVVTFDPHPQIVLAKPDREPVRLLTTINERVALLQDAGVDEVVIIPFTKEFAATPAERFVEEIIVRKIGVTHFFIGHDHMFGRNRGGDVSTLRSMGTDLGFTVEQIPALVLDDMTISSTKIRTALKEGAIEPANHWLGYDYGVHGRVVHGDARGRTIGFPTANILPESPVKLLPGHGVYVVSLEVGGRRMFGVANVGRRPTVTDGSIVALEVHVLDFDGDLYDREVTVTFHRFVRHEERFASVDDLRTQIAVDVAESRDVIKQLNIQHS
jgi:riboflavin kinase/FMN adenylyltransferase